MSYIFSKIVERRVKNDTTPIKTVGCVSHAPFGTPWDKNARPAIVEVDRANAFSVLANAVKIRPFARLDETGPVKWVAAIGPLDHLELDLS
jgi:hypothetical protein